MEKRFCKVTALFLAMVLLFSLSGCGDADEKGKITNVGVYIESGDYYAPIIEGAEQYCKQAGLTAHIATGHPHGGADADYWGSVADNDIIVMHYFYEYTCLALAKEYPDKHFISIGSCIASADGVCPNDNVLHIDMEYVQKAFLAGYLAAKVSQTGEIAIVIDPNKNPDANSDTKALWPTVAAAYAKGAETADEKVKINVIYSGCDWYLAPKAGDIIYAINKNTNADVVAAYDTVSLSTSMQQIKTDRKIWLVNCFVKETRKEHNTDALNNHLLTSVYKQYDKKISEIIDNTIKGSQQYGISITPAADKGWIDFDKCDNFNAVVSEQVQQEIQQVMQNIQDYDLPNEKSCSYADIKNIGNQIIIN